MPMFTNLDRDLKAAYDNDDERASQRVADGFRQLSDGLLGIVDSHVAAVLALPGDPVANLREHGMEHTAASIERMRRTAA